ncbi:hypothetical protein Sm713_21670 [Streptomyces sp. TS71-3]|nr:hypothetical protein Sm713_21670 [Streptomyces sp. TS71-3]
MGLFRLCPDHRWVGLRPDKRLRRLDRPGGAVSVVSGSSVGGWLLAQFPAPLSGRGFAPIPRLASRLPHPYRGGARPCQGRGELRDQLRRGRWIVTGLKGRLGDRGGARPCQGRGELRDQLRRGRRMATGPKGQTGIGAKPRPDRGTGGSAP